MFTIEQVFTRDFDKITEAAKVREEGLLFDAAAVLRRLLFDDDPLVHQVNRTRKKKLLFRINKPKVIWETPGIPVPDFYALHEGMSPRLVLYQSNHSVKLDGFLKSPALYVQGTPVSVIDFLKYVAHNAGAVHRSETTSESGKLIESIIPLAGDAQKVMEHFLFATMGPAPTVLRILVGICDVTASALTPLYMDIKGSG